VFVAWKKIVALKPRDASGIYIKKRAEASPFFAQKKFSL